MMMAQNLLLKVSVYGAMRSLASIMMYDIWYKRIWCPIRLNRLLVRSLSWILSNPTAMNVVSRFSLKAPQNPPYLTCAKAWGKIVMVRNTKTYKTRHIGRVQNSESLKSVSEIWESNSRRISGDSISSFYGMYVCVCIYICMYRYVCM